MSVNRERCLTVYVDEGVKHSLVTLNQHGNLFGYLLCDNLERRWIDLDVRGVCC